MNHQAERRVGTVIGAKWRVDGLLGSGSMAAVYAVTHRNGARAALKILHPTLCTDPAVCERFLGEGYLTNSVKHPGIVRVLDDGVTDDGCVFLVMDLLEGETLEAYRQNHGGRIPLVESLDLAEKLMDVLAAVHHAGIIHRDLKPQNVFVCNDGTVKLLDFGVARVFDRTSQSKLSLFGLVLGTPSFMSPEQALGSRDKVDHRSDIWSLGATLFTALTGETVHLGANVQAKLLAAATVKARSIAMVMPDLPAPIAAAIDMALRFKKEDRWQSVDAFRRAIRDARAELGLGRLVTPVSPFSPEAAHAKPIGGSLPPGKPGSLPPPADGAFDGSATVKAASPVSGPDGTFIGMGTADGGVQGVVGNDGSLPPAGPHAQHGPSIPGPPRAPFPSHPGAVGGAAAVPGAPGGPSGTRVMSPVIAAQPMRASRPDHQEGSIPATYGGPDDTFGETDPRVYGMRRKGSVGVWLVAVLLASAALASITFFAVKGQREHANAGNDPSPTTTVTDAPAPSVSATLPAPAPLGTIEIGDPMTPAAADGGAPRGSTTTATRPTTPIVPGPTGGAAVTRPYRPARPPQGTTTPATPVTATPGNDTPPAATTSEPTRPPPGLAPDPFGTPD